MRAEDFLRKYPDVTGDDHAIDKHLLTIAQRALDADRPEELRRLMELGPLSLFGVAATLS
jgi:hypothetical protein